MTVRRFIWLSGVSLGLIWLWMLAPMMVLGALWGGVMPVWPPVVSGSQTDFVAWALTFTAAYGIPPIAVALIVFGLRARRD